MAFRRKKLNNLYGTMSKKKKNEKVEPENEAVTPEVCEEETETTAEEQVEESEKTEEKEQEVKKEPTVEEQLQTAKETILRKVAEFDNFRKRKAKEVDDARVYGKVSVITEFLTVFDHFKMAMTSVENGDDIKIVQEGMRMILAEFSRTFENLGVKEVNAVGEKFDPTLHEAISHEASDDMEADHVLKQWKSGYKLNDRLIRPATVVVSSGKAEETEEEA